MSPPIFDVNRYTRVVFFTGAGMSAECGVPTYRGHGGIWSQYRWQDYACQRAFEKDARSVQNFHQTRRRKVLECAPHAGHFRLAQLESLHPSLAIVTQNIDGMHQRAGSRSVVELHGSLWRVRCELHGRSVDLAHAAYARRVCPQCGRPLRPDITWFEDRVDTDVWGAAEALIAACDLFVSIGTSGSVWPAAGLAELARSRGAETVEVNVEVNEASALYRHCIRDPASIAVCRSFPAPGITNP